MESKDSYPACRKGNDVYIPPQTSTHTETLIFLHGLGDTADGGWSSFFANKRSSPCPPTTKVVLLQAPTISVTAYNGEKKTAWFDIQNLFETDVNKFVQTVNVDDIKKSTEHIRAVLKEEIALLGGDSRSVILAGFSQGCGMALHVGLQYEEPLGAVIGWSGYLFPITKVSEANANTPVFIGHGDQDPKVPFGKAMETYERLDEKKHQVVKVLVKGMGHEINKDVAREAESFIRRIAGKNQSKL